MTKSIYREPATDVSEAPSVTASRAPSRLIPLDVLRFLAIVLVIGRHILTPSSEAARLAPFARVWESVGWTGVDLFFVLSGFLIGGLLFREIGRTGTLNVPRFMIRRAFKIWPLYLVYLVILVLVSVGHRHQSLSDTVHHFWPYFLHIQNYHMEASVYLYFPVGHLWSLAVEEHFYLLLPPLLLLFTRKQGVDGLRPLPVLALCLMVGILAMRFYTFHQYHTWESNQFPTHLRLDSLLAGVLLGYAWHGHPQRLAPFLAHPRLLALIGLALVLPVGLANDAWFITTIGFTMLYVGYGCILLAIMASTVPDSPKDWADLWNGRVATALATVGGWSYATYLLHTWYGKVPAIWLLSHNVPGLHGGLRWAIVMAVYVGFSFALGGIVSTLIESPLLALRNRMFPAR